MATLLASLSSDDEGPELRNHEEDDSDSELEMEESFQFGGILGEDGGLFATKATAGWSYAQVLQDLERQNQESSKNAASTSVPRMDVASLIAAKRRAIAGKDHSRTTEKPAPQPKDGAVPDETAPDENDDSSREGGGVGSDDSSDVDDSSAHSTDTGASDDDDHLAITEESHPDLGDDVLKTRAGADAEEDDDRNLRRHNDGASDGESVSDDDIDAAEATKVAAFFDQQSADTSIEVFSQLALSRPILRGVAAMGFVKPTPIQATVIPLALAGRDICASAVTGSGKTAAFLLPVLERLLHRQRGTSIKAVVLAPTRELAAQCMAFASTFAQFTKVRASLVVGGSKNGPAQQAELRSRPDLVIATPGRLLDHVLNSPGVTLESVEFLVLDEADRLLDLGFQEEVHELIKHCPTQRQTLLFSATMNTKVDDLVQLSLKRPVRVRISNKDTRSASSKDIEVAPRLEQEFVRVRAGNEGFNREAMLLALLTRTFTKQTIVFFDTKAAAHRMMIICGLCGIKCAELHGNLTQQQRLGALDEFKRNDVDVLLASDLACRGLDIESVKTVINFEMPSTIETYVHRIGRTARAGRGGRSCTLIGEGRRYLMKELIKDAEAKSKRNDGSEPSSARGVIRSRAIPPAVISHFAGKIQSLESHVDEVLQAEEVARMDRLAEMEAIKAQNIIEHSAEIKSRPQKEWFLSNSQKQLIKQTAAERQKQIEERIGTGTHRMTRKKRRAREALQALNASAPEDGEDDAPPRRRPVNAKAEARKAKRKEAAKEHNAAGKSVHDLDLEKERRQAKKRKAGAHAAGDASLFDEDKAAYSPAKSKNFASESSVAQSSFRFRGFDPAKKLGKKKGNKAFKSKSKYKRK